MEQRRRDRQYRKRKSRKQKPKVNNVANQITAGTSDNVSGEVGAEQPPSGSTLLAHAIRATGILPIIGLISILLTHHFYTAYIPQWFHTVVKQEVAVLTLCAGHAGIIGISISLRRVQHGWSTFALAVAAFATAGAGYRAIGDDMTGHIVVLLLFLSIVPAIWAEAISRSLSSLWRFIRTRTGMMSILLLVAVPLIIHNQLQNENYVRNWIVIPLFVVLGVLTTAMALWLLFKLASKCRSIAFSLVKLLAINAFKNFARKATQKK